MKLISLRVYRLGEFPFHHTKKKIFPEGIQFVLNFTCIISKTQNKNTELQEGSWMVGAREHVEEERTKSLWKKALPTQASHDFYRVLTQKT